jgi:acetyl esterase/lipase
MSRAALIAVALSVSASVAAQQPPAVPPEVAAKVTTVDRYPAHDITFPNGVTGVPGAVYWEPVGYRPLTLDLYLPPGSVKRPAAGLPLVVYIHGGGWMGGDRHRSGPFVDFPGVLASLAAKGYVVASIEYRLSGEAKFPAQAQDVKAAIRWLRLNASKYGIDPVRAVTWGVSAGGHLAALATVSCKVAALEPAQTVRPGVPDAKPEPISSAAVSDCVQGGVAWYGVFDMATIADQARGTKVMSRDGPDAPEWRLLGCFGKECQPEEVAAASPVTYVDRDDPPMLLIVGTEDTTVPHQQTLEMADTLKAAGAQYELVALPAVGHGLIGKTLEETRDANLKALAATFRFIDQTIGNTAVTGR